MTVNLYPHQREAVDKLGNGKILWGGVGTGKSLTAVAYYMQKECPRDVYVITTAMKRDSLDWQGEFARFGIGTESNATVGGVLTIDSWNNIGRYQDVKDSFFIFDEQRLVGSGKWSSVFIKIAKSNRWILLSATPGDTWMDYVPVFVANGFYKNRSEFKREHVVYSPYAKFPKIERYNGTGRLLRLRNSLLVEMPYRKHTIRNSIDVVVSYNKLIFNKVVRERWNVFEEKPLQDAGELFRVMRKVVNTDGSRLEAVKQLMEKHPRLIVFYNFDYELEKLRSLSQENSLSNHDSKTATCDISSANKDENRSLKTPSRRPRKPAEKAVETIKPQPGAIPWVTKEWNGHRHDSLPQGKQWLYLVQYTAGSEGWNCIDTDATCFYSLPYSYKQWHQAHGRIDRLSTPYTHLYYYTLRSDAIIDTLIWEALCDKKNFNESLVGADKYAE